MKGFRRKPSTKPPCISVGRSIVTCRSPQCGVSEKDSLSLWAGWALNPPTLCLHSTRYDLCKRYFGLSLQAHRKNGMPRFSFFSSSSANESHKLRVLAPPWGPCIQAGHRIWPSTLAHLLAKLPGGERDYSWLSELEAEQKNMRHLRRMNIFKCIFFKAF